MFEVILLGTGGMVPLPDRYLTALMVRHNGKAVLIDCGEGTQVAIRAAGLGFKQIDAICLTHFHADHTAGLPGLLLTIGNSGKETPLTVIGPKHVRNVVDCLSVVAPNLPYPLEYIEVENDSRIDLWDSLTVCTHLVEHWISCYAYKLKLGRQGRFDAERARFLGIPVQYWSLLQAGNPVEVSGRMVSPHDVMGKPRKGIALCYATDMRPSDSLAEFAAEADLFVCEGMYGDPDMLGKAKEHRHCMFSEAAEMAKKACVKELWLTHFSPSMPDPGKYAHIASGIFPNVHIDKKSTILRFGEES